MPCAISIYIYSRIWVDATILSLFILFIEQQNIDDHEIGQSSNQVVLHEDEIAIFCAKTQEVFLLFSL